MKRQFVFGSFSFIMLLALALVPLASALAAGGETTRVSVDSSGVQGNRPSFEASISSDSRYVAFSSYANNLVAGDTNSAGDIFVHDRSTGVTERVSIDSLGAEGDDISHSPAISSDGRYVAFSSEATNLVALDTNSFTDIFVHDRNTGVTERVSVSTGGVEANGFSYSPDISDNGRYVSFTSAASTLVVLDTNGFHDVFVHDRSTGITERVSVDSSGTEGDLFSSGQSISGDGRFVAFNSIASNLVAGDTNNYYDIFVHDRQTDTTERVSVDGGAEADSSSYSPSISADGSIVAFRSYATNLVTGDGNAVFDIFVHDRTTGITTRASVDSSGAEGNGESPGVSISSDGRYVAFYSEASNLVALDTNGAADIFVHDRSTGTTERVSVDSSGVEGNDVSYSSSISGDGRFVAFNSEASNLVAGDTNDKEDVFVHELGTPPSEGKTCSQEVDSGGATVLVCGRIRITLPANAIPGGEKNCKIVIKEKGDSGLYGFSLDDTVWDVKILCDSGEVSLFFAPISVCIRPTDGVVADKQVFHNHGGGFGPLAASGGISGYVCGETRQLSLFTLGEFVLPDTGFAPGAETILGEQPAALAYAASDLVLNIPSLNVQLDIVGVPQSPNGWDVSWLASSQAGYLYGTAYPTWAGNSVLTAHVWNADNTAGPFYNLKSLQGGDQFSIVAAGRTYTYEVRSNALVSEHGISVLADSSYAMITLVTCEGFNEASGDYIYRRAVQAVLVSVD